MDIHITINKCSECKYGSHTGAFTKGGAKPCCDHDITVKEKGYDCFKRIIPYRSEDNEILHRIQHVAKGIPNWCPLTRGFKY